MINVSSIFFFLQFCLISFPCETVSMSFYFLKSVTPLGVSESLVIKVMLSFFLFYYIKIVDISI